MSTSREPFLHAYVAALLLLFEDCLSSKRFLVSRLFVCIGSLKDYMVPFERARNVNITWNFSSMRMCVIPVLAFWVSNIKVRFCITMVLVVLEGNK